MTAIDYLLLAGVLLAGGYVVARLFIGWLYSPARPNETEPGESGRLSVPNRALERAGTTSAPWHIRK